MAVRTDPEAGAKLTLEPQKQLMGDRKLFAQNVGVMLAWTMFRKCGPPRPGSQPDFGSVLGLILQSQCAVCLAWQQSFD